MSVGLSENIWALATSYKVEGLQRAKTLIVLNGINKHTNVNLHLVMNETVSGDLVLEWRVVHEYRHT